MKQVIMAVILIAVANVTYAFETEANEGFELKSDTTKVNCTPTADGFLECMSKKDASIKSDSNTAKFACYSKAKINIKTGATQETMVCKEKK
jgi:hypothetical protein